MDKVKFWNNPALIQKRVIGQGSFGIAVEAEHNLDKVLHIVKCVSLHKLGSPSFCFTNVTREIRILMKMKSPSLVSYENCWVEDFALPELQKSDDGSYTIERKAELVQEALEDEPLLRCMKSPTLYIQMERCLPGRDLSSWLKGLNAKVPEKEIIHLLMFLTGGLYDLGRRGIIHRDLKPDNIFHTGGAVPLCDWKIGDLGLAVDVREDELTNEGNRLYMSPEIDAGRDYTTQADVFSMGLIFLEIVAAAALGERSKARNAFRDLKLAENESDTKLIVTSVLAGASIEFQLVKTIIGMVLGNDGERFTAADVYHRMTSIHAGMPQILEKYPTWPQEFRINKGGNARDELSTTIFCKSPSTLFEYELTFMPKNSSPTNIHLSFFHTHSVSFEKTLLKSAWSAEEDFGILSIGDPLPYWNNPIYQPVQETLKGKFGVLINAQHKLDRESHDVKCLSLKHYLTSTKPDFEDIRKELQKTLKISSPYVVGHRDSWIEDFCLPLQHIADSMAVSRPLPNIQGMAYPTLYIATECAFGCPTLRQWLQSNPSFEQRVAQATDILTNVSADLKHIHEVGIVHSSLSPDNIYFVKATNCWKIGGLGPPISPEGEREKMDGFCTDFRSPEEAKFNQLSAESNVFSVGLVFLLVTNPLPNFGMKGIITKIREEYTGNPAQLLEILGAKEEKWLACANCTSLVGPMICPTPKDRISSSQLFQYMFRVNTISKGRAFQSCKATVFGKMTTSFTCKHLESGCLYNVEMKPTFRQFGVGQFISAEAAEDARQLCNSIQDGRWDIKIDL